MRRPPRGILIISVLALVLGIYQLWAVVTGYQQLPVDPRDRLPAPTTFTQAFSLGLPFIFTCVLVAGLLFWEQGDWGKVFALAAIAALFFYQFFFFSSLLFIPAMLSIVYLIFWGRWTSPLNSKRLKDNSSNQNITRIQKIRILKTTVLFMLVIGMAFLPLVNTYQPFSSSAPDQPVNPDTGLDFEARQVLYLERYGKTNVISSAFLNESINEDRLLRELPKIIAGEDCKDFGMSRLLRFFYYENITGPAGKISEDTRTQVKEVLLGAKYWFAEPGSQDDAIYWTENHQIAYHSCELLAGQLWKNEIFTRSGMTGIEHVTHATEMASRWMDWRAQYGFFEWYSNTYLAVDIYSLLNIYDCAENRTLATKAAMVLDLILFDLASNWYNGRLATTMGRCYGDSLVGTSANHLPEYEEITQVAWLFLGLGRDIGSRSLAAIAASTTSYKPPAVLEQIAQDAAGNFEHKSRSGVLASDGPTLGIPYDEENLMFWWGQANPVSQWTIDTSFDVIEKYDIDPNILVGAGIPEGARIGSQIRGVSLSQFASYLKELTQGVALETTNTYTYRTPYYQLSGAQDRQKGLNGLQELTWQARLNDYAVVFTNAPGGISFKGGPFMGGWKPRATFYQNVGVIQYDRNHRTLEGSVMFFLLDSVINLDQGNRPYNHAYFPTWAFDSVVEKGHWVFGEVDGGYVALYSTNPTYWASNVELQSMGKRNCWLVELGSVADCGSFQEFVRQVTAAKVVVRPLSMGYSVEYHSPSQGIVRVAWDGPMTVNGTDVDLGPYDRYENQYSQTTFGAREMVIEHAGQRLTLNFDAVTRLLEVV